jgi:hypothetical protein
MIEVGQAAPVRHFCTCFDSAQAPRGLVMMGSILRFLPDARFHVLALDDTACRIVGELQSAVRLVRPAELAAFDPELAAMGAQEPAAWIPGLARLVLAREPGAEAVTFLGADLFFYRSPAEVFAAIGPASIAITPHRLTPANAGRSASGRYRLSWIGWRNDPEGRRCLEEYRNDCLAARGRTAPQALLDQWPARYQGVCELAGKGFNLAPWNVEDHLLRREGEAILVDDEPLLSYDFQGLRHLEGAVWDTRFREYGVQKNQPFLVEAVYKPYLAQLAATFNGLAARHGLSLSGPPQPAGQRLRPAAPGKPAAPVALFAYRRPDHLRRTLEGLKTNELAEHTPLILFLDGARNDRDAAGVAEVRRIARSVQGFRSVTTVERESNLGLAGSIIRGVTEVLKEYDDVIVVEDDLDTSRYFLKFMNDGLNAYRDNPRIASINAYMYPVKEPLPEVFFMRDADCWGWATWGRAWKFFEPNGQSLLQSLIDRDLRYLFDYQGAFPYTNMLINQINGRNQSWAIRWRASAFINDMLSLFPGRSLTHNSGLDNSGEHCGVNESYDTFVAQTPIVIGDPPIVHHDEAFRIIRNFHIDTLKGRG